MSTEAILLGPVSFVSPTQALGGPKAKAIFALLSLSAGSVVSDSELIDGVWENDPPAAVNATIQAYISRLRKLCLDRGHDIQRLGTGYRLEIPRASVDAHQLADQLAIAERTVSPQARAVQLASVASLVGEEPLGGCPATAAIGIARQQLEALQLRAVQSFATTALSVELNVPSGVFRVADRNPTAEAAQAALCTMLWHHGRTAEARQRLDWVIEHCRSALGQEPSDFLTALDLRLSAGGPTEPAAATPNSSKDVGSTALRDSATPGLVGRSDEQQILRNAVTGPDPSVVVITGEGGIGKTTLVRASLPGVIWADDPTVGRTPWPWVWELIGTKPPPVPDHATLYELIETSTRAIVARLQSEGRQRTLVVDDLQNRSAVAQLQFTALARAMEGTRLNLVGISREIPTGLNALTSGGSPALTFIALTPLSDEDARVLVQHQLRVDDPRVQRLLDESGGLPLLLSHGIQRISATSTSEQSDEHRRLLRLVALARSVERADLIEVLGSFVSAVATELATTGQLVIDHQTIAFRHDRLAEAVLAIPATDVELADQHHLAEMLVKRWDGSAQAAVALSDLLEGTTLSAPAVHLAAGTQHQLARDWQTAAIAHERAITATEGSDSIAQRAAECWIRAGDLWKARKLLAVRVDSELEQLASQYDIAEDPATDIGAFVEYISYGTTGFRMDERVRDILRLRPTTTPDDPLSLMLDAVELTEIRRGTVSGASASLSADELLAYARATGDPRAIAWALGPRLVEALNADDHVRLVALADELEANAAGPEQAEIPVVANWYRFEAALRRGDGSDADAQLAAIEHRALTTMEVPSRWYGNSLRAGRHINEGRLDEAERCLQLAFELGKISIGSEAHASYGAGLLMVRWFQDRSPELLAAAPPPADDAPLGAPTLGLVFGAFIRSVVPGSADSDELARAAARASNSLEHALVAEAALATSNESIAHDVLANFRPRAPIVVMPAGLYVAAADSVRGRLLALTGDRKSAAAALTRGAEIELGAGAVLASKRTHLAYASVLVANGDRAAGHRRAADVEHWARSHSVPALERQALELRARSSLP